MSTISDEENNMSFDEQSVIIIRRISEEEITNWKYECEKNPAYIIACERPKSKRITFRVARSIECPQDDGLKWWANVTQDMTFRYAERWRKKAFEKLGIEKGRIITAVLFPDERFNREFESQLYHWWATQREFMIGEFVCLHV